jgi:hypothetical protein
VVGSHSKKMAGVEIDQKEYLRISAAELSLEEHGEIQAAVASNDKAMARALAIHRINEQEDSYIPIMLLQNLVDLIDGTEEPLSGADSSKPLSEKRANDWPRRKCSSAGCKNLETRSGEFKSYSKCKLTAYCSRGELYFTLTFTSCV